MRPRMDYGAPEAYERLIAPRYAPLARELVAAAAPVPGERVLELGAGTGLVTRIVAPLVQPGGSLVVTDRSPAMLSLARNLTPGPAAYAVLDHTAPLPFLDASFDLVLSGLTYVQDHDASVAELRRVTAPEGRLVLTMWGPRYLELEMMSAARVRLGDDPLPAPAPDAAAERLRRAGFADVSVRELADEPRYESVAEYLAYRRGFGVPEGTDPADHERGLAALGEEAERRVAADGSFTQGWRFALIHAAGADRT